MATRQNPHYPIERSAQDAMMLVAAVASEDGRLEDEALRNALSNTDHTLLAWNLAELTVLAVRLMSQHTAQSESDLLQELGLALAQTLDARSGNDNS